MKLLLDTHLLLWTFGVPGNLSAGARAIIADEENELFFSVVNIWEVAIKHTQERRSLGADPHSLRRELLDNEYTEIPVTSDHVLLIPFLPLIHKDPFDRMLIAQAAFEGLTLLTADKIIAQYPGPIRLV